MSDTSKSDMDKNLSAGTSPSTVELKKRARRLNGLPMFLALTAAVIIAVTLSLVVLNRQKSSTEPGEASGGRNALALARNLVGEGSGGVVAAKQQPAPITPAIVPDAARVVERPSVPPPRAPETPRMSEEERRLRERRLRQMEAVIDGPIKARIEEVKVEPRSLDAEIARVEQQLAALGTVGGDGYAERLAAAQAAVNAGVGGSGGNAASPLNQFGAVDGDWRNRAVVEAPASFHIIRTGSVIPATLVSGISSDLPGQIVGQVSQDVYDTPTGKHLLIPQGARLVGEYSSQVQYGQSRIFAVWQRIVFPDGKALDLGSMPGSSGAGYGGFRDRVNNHYLRVFGSAIMMSAILSGVEMTQDSGGDGTESNRQRMSDALSEALGNQLGGVMAEMLSKNMNIAPTLEIRPGYRFNVMLVKDLEFDGAYRGFDYAAR